jgi:hypothetical protein
MIWFILFKKTKVYFMVLTDQALDKQQEALTCK